MAGQPTKKPTVATPSSAYSKMQPRWHMIDVLLGGTEALRAAGKAFLPQYDNESDKAYQTRLERATLLNLTEQTLDTLAGKPFKEQLVTGDDMPAQIADEVILDIDMQGTNLHSFCRNWFREGWAKGFSHVLVEHPVPEPKLDAEGNALPRTLADDRAEGLRPYWVHIKPENLIAAFSEVQNGKEVLTHVRIMETSIERAEWGEVQVTRVRVLEPGSWQVYRPVDKKDDEWVLEEEGTTGLDYIPLVTFYSAKREGLMDCKPPLTDLAHLNIAHWQSSSDQRNVLTVARFPILAASGVPADAPVAIGPNKFLTTDDAAGKWYYVEHSGAAIKAGAEDLASLEDQMATYGAEFLRKKPGDATATGRALDSAEATSYLASTVHDFQDCVEQALQYTADWMKLDTGGSVTINADVDLSEVNSAELDTLVKIRAQRDISRVSLLGEMQRRGILADDFDAEADAELLQEESANTMGDMFNGGQGTQTPPTPGNQSDPNNPGADPNNPGGGTNNQDPNALQSTTPPGAGGS